MTAIQQCPVDTSSLGLNSCSATDSRTALDGPGIISYVMMCPLQDHTRPVPSTQHT